MEDGPRGKAGEDAVYNAAQVQGNAQNIVKILQEEQAEKHAKAEMELN